MDGGLIKRGRQQETVVDKWRSDRGHVQYLSQSRESGHDVKKSISTNLPKLVGNQRALLFRLSKD